jgi:hypothetical protein
MFFFIMFFFTVVYSLARWIYKFLFFPVSNCVVNIPLALERVYAKMGHLCTLLGHAKCHVMTGQGQTQRRDGLFFSAQITLGIDFARSTASFYSHSGHLVCWTNTSGSVHGARKSAMEALPAGVPEKYKYARIAKKGIHRGGPPGLSRRFGAACKS